MNRILSLNPRQREPNHNHSQQLDMLKEELEKLPMA